MHAEIYESEAYWTEEAFADPLTQARFKRTLAMVPEDIRTLADIGCGNGVFLRKLAQSRPELMLHGVDRSTAALSKVVGAETRQADITKLPFEDRSMDCVSCLEVIEHLPIPTFGLALDELARVSARYVLISVPFKERVERHRTSCPYCGTSFNADLHLHSFDRDRVERLLAPYGFRAVQVEVFEPYDRYVGALTYYRHLERGLFNSPSCPVCLFQNPAYHVRAAREAGVLERGAGSKVKSVIKAFWPKRRIEGNWIAALYARN